MKIYKPKRIITKLKNYLRKIYCFLEQKIYYIITLVPFIPKYCIIMVDGGLGSQIFKYALGESIKQNTKLKVFYDLSWFENNGMDVNGIHSRKFEITSVFPNVKMESPKAYLLKITKQNNLYIQKYPYIFNDEIYKEKNVYLQGYYPNIEYFNIAKQKLLETLQFNIFIKNNTFLPKPNSIAVHVRLGDYLNSIHDVLTANYFIKGINHFIKIFNSDCFFYFFTTDSNYIRNEIIYSISDKINYEIIEGTDENGAVDMYRMSLFNNFIISNSSFSLIPAWLNQDKGIIVMPSKWLNESNDLTVNSDKAFRIKNAIIIDV